MPEEAAYLECEQQVWYTNDWLMVAIPTVIVLFLVSMIVFRLFGEGTTKIARKIEKKKPKTAKALFATGKIAGTFGVGMPSEVIKEKANYLKGD